MIKYIAVFIWGAFVGIGTLLGFVWWEEKNKK